MFIKTLGGKFHRATITGADVNYEGSICIDSNLLAKAQLKTYTAVNVWNVTNGNRIETYVLPGKKGEFCINGAAAHLFNVNDIVIVAWWRYWDPNTGIQLEPNIYLMDKLNRIKKAEDFDTDTKTYTVT